MHGNFRVSDFVTFLQELGKAEQAYFLEGGQAVNFWAEYFTAKEKGEKLSAFQPFTSEDCDIWVSHAAAKYLGQKQAGTLVKGTSPAQGQLGIFTLEGEPPRTIDLLIGVYGIPPEEHNHLCVRALTVNGVTVMDPLNLFRSKCHCLLGLDQTERQDERHLKMLCLILPAYFSDLIEEAKMGETTEREIIKDVKLLRKICSTNVCRRALAEIGLLPEALIPATEMEQCGLPLLERFAKTQLQNQT